MNSQSQKFFFNDMKRSMEKGAFREKIEGLGDPATCWMPDHYVDRPNQPLRWRHHPLHLFSHH